MQAALRAFRSRKANNAPAAPWSRSVKQTLKMKSPVPVSLGSLELGLIMGIPAAWAMGAATRETLERLAPSRPTILSYSMSRVTRSMLWAGWPWSSRITSSSGLPRTPPRWFHSCTAIW